jgi:hypothetical protein
MECQAKGNSMSDINEGRIVRFIPGNPSKAVIEVALPDIEHVTKRQYERVLVEFVDNRRLTDDQRKKAWAILGEIADWQGDLPESIHRLMKLKFKVEMLKSLANEIFSLSNCDMTTAREYISYLIDFMITWGVPSKVPLYELCEDIQRYVYTCAINKRCAVCGVKAEIHHTPAIGRGFDRNKVNHIGMTALPLCREHHMEIHAKPEHEFFDKYHLESVVIDTKIAKVYKLNTKEKTA